MTDIKVDYIDHMGDDLRVANAARVSFDKESEWVVLPEMPGAQTYEEKILSKGDEKLIQYLAKHNHWTPFSHCMITLRETIPIFVARQRFKHMVGFTYNEVSRRYVDDNPDFFVPDVWRSRPDGSVKQGSGKKEITYIKLQKSKPFVSDYVKNLNSICLTVYTKLLEAGVAPEQARMVLPQAAMTSYYVTGSLAAFSRAYLLRSKPDAQKEIQDLAEHWNRIISPLFPVSWEALNAQAD